MFPEWEEASRMKAVVSLFWEVGRKEGLPEILLKAVVPLYLLGGSPEIPLPFRGKTLGADLIQQPGNILRM